MYGDTLAIDDFPSNFLHYLRWWWEWPKNVQPRVLKGHDVSTWCCAWGGWCDRLENLWHLSYFCVVYLQYLFMIGQ